MHDTRDLDVALTRLGAKDDALPSRALIAGVLVRTVIVTTVAMVLAAVLVAGGMAFLISW